MIPKRIHYCWFGGNPKSELIQKCIDSWYKYCPDYEIVEWNETNFDVNQLIYTRDAYKEKKWAFVSDYARLWCVYNGGVYFDTDVLLHNRIDELLQYDCWIASDDVRYISTGLGFGAKKGNAIIKLLMDAYNHYQYPCGTNVINDTKILEGNYPNWRKSNRLQFIDNNVIVLGMNDYIKYARHLYTESWGDDQGVGKQKRILEELNGVRHRKDKIMWKIKCWIRSPRIVDFFDQRKETTAEKIYTFVAYDLLDYGIKHFIIRLFTKSTRGMK